MTHTLDRRIKTDTIKVGDRNIEISKLNRRQILEHLEELKKTCSQAEIEELWLNSKKS